MDKELAPNYGVEEGNYIPSPLFPSIGIPRIRERQMIKRRVKMIIQNKIGIRMNSKRIVTFMKVNKKMTIVILKCKVQCQR